MRDQLRAAVPRPIAGHGADLSTLERFVLTKIDGRRSVTDVAGLVSITVDEALAIVLSLVERRAARIDGAPSKPQRRTSSGFRRRAEVAGPVEDDVVTLGDDDFEEVFDEATLSDDPAHASVFAAETVAGTMRAITVEEAERAVERAARSTPDARVAPARSAKR